MYAVSASSFCGSPAIHGKGGMTDPGTKLRGSRKCVACHCESYLPPTRERSGPDSPRAEHVRVVVDELVRRGDGAALVSPAGAVRVGLDRAGLLRVTVPAALGDVDRATRHDFLGLLIALGGERRIILEPGAGRDQLASSRGGATVVNTPPIAKKATAATTNSALLLSMFFSMSVPSSCHRSLVTEVVGGDHVPEEQKDPDEHQRAAHQAHRPKGVHETHGVDERDRRVVPLKP